MSQEQIWPPAARLMNRLRQSTERFEAELLAYCLEVPEPGAFVEHLLEEVTLVRLELRAALGLTR
jgi:hypothetical protein